MFKYYTSAKIIVYRKQIQNTLFTKLQNARWAATVTAGKQPFFDEASLAAAKPFEEIPSLRILPWIGTGWMYMPIVGKFDIQKLHLAGMEKWKILGDIYREKFGNLNSVVSHKVEDLQVIYNNEGVYPDRGVIYSVKKYRESRKHWYKTAGLMILDGKEWHDLRSKTQKHLMKPRAIQAYLNPMQDVARELVHKMYKCRDSNKEVPDFLGELYKWALESVALVGLDTRLGCLEKNLSPDSEALKMIKSVQTQFDLLYKLEPFSGNLQLWKIFPTPMWKRYTKAADTFTEIAFKYINRALDKLQTSSEDAEKDLTLLQSMLMEKGLDVSGAMVTVADMLLAGIDTTSHTVGFFLYHMARNPEKQELLYQEISNLLPKREDRITQAVFNEMKYLKACMKESQRLDPVVIGNVRRLDRDIILSGYRVPAGTILFAPTQIMHRDERYFPNPNIFLPERWLNKDEKPHPFAFIPFGIGTRSCIGRRLAELEIICLITEMIRNFRIEYHHEDIGMITRAISVPDKPLRYNFIER